jgi:hypothetical protein
MSYRKSVQPIVYPAVADALMAALSARPAAALMAAPNVHLFGNDFTPSPFSVLANFTDVTFTGGAAVAQGTLLGPVWLDNIIRGMLVNTTFTCTVTPSPGQTIFGYYLTDAANALLWVAERFADPVPINTAGDFLSLDYVWAEPLIRQTAQTEL